MLALSVDLRGRLEAFAAVRGWTGFHTPRNLVLALVGEVGQLAELVQWRTDEEVGQLAADPEGLEGLGA